MNLTAQSADAVTVEACGHRASPACDALADGVTEETREIGRHQRDERQHNDQAQDELREHSSSEDRRAVKTAVKTAAEGQWGRDGGGSQEKSTSSRFS